VFLYSKTTLLMSHRKSQLAIISPYVAIFVNI